MTINKSSFKSTQTDPFFSRNWKIKSFQVANRIVSAQNSGRKFPEIMSLQIYFPFHVPFPYIGNPSLCILDVEKDVSLY